MGVVGGLGGIRGGDREVHVVHQGVENAGEPRVAFLAFAGVGPFEPVMPFVACDVAVVVDVD